MNPTPQPHNIPLRWALVFAVTLAVAVAAPAVLVDHLLGERPQESGRIFLDWHRVPVRDAEVYSLRWIEYGQVHTVDVEGAEARDKVVAWLEGK